MNKETGTFLTGLGFMALGVADAFMNPFAFATAPQFWFTGASLMGASLGISKIGGKQDGQ